MNEKNKFNDQAKALSVQTHQLNSAQVQLGNIDATLDSMLAEQAENQRSLGQLLRQAQSLVAGGYEGKALPLEGDIYVETDEIAFPHREIKSLDRIDHITITDSADWAQYLDQVEVYAARHGIEVGKDPFQNLMSTSQRIALEKRIREEFSLKTANCDKYDYMIAGTCGLIGGLIDVLFVGLPGQGALSHFTDDMTGQAVQKFAALNGWSGPREGKDPTASAIGFLERNYRVNYDHRHGGDVDGLFNMSTKNHHIKSLAHSPDLVGLFFSILDQFTSTSHFVDNGKIISVNTENFELKGTNLISKLFAGFSNWLGHLFSDVAGSSGAQERGAGIPIPFYSLLQFVNVGEFGQHKQAFAKIAVQVFEQGYDFRHGGALAIPVLATELLTRITWVVKQWFYHKKPWAECVPLANNPELRRMLLVAHGSLCLVDAADATVRSGGNMIQFMLRCNLIAWTRFGTVALRELRVWYCEGDLDVEAVDIYLDAEYKRLLAT